MSFWEPLVDTILEKYTKFEKKQSLERQLVISLATLEMN